MSENVATLNQAEGADESLASRGSGLCKWNAGGLSWNPDKWRGTHNVSAYMKAFDKVEPCANGAATGSLFCVDHSCVVCVKEGRVLNNKCVGCQREVSIFDEDNS